MKNLGQMMKQAQKMQEKMAELQNSLGQAEITGQSAGGMVVATLNGKGELRKLKIDRSLVDPDEVEVIEDLVIAACADGKSKVEAYAAQEMSKLTGGIELPEGFKLPF